MKEFLEISEYIEFSWEEIFENCHDLYEKLHKRKIVFISIWTGGWIPAKIIKEYMNDSEDFVSYTLIAGYKNLHTQEEKCQILQGFSEKTMSEIQNFQKQNYEIVIFDTLINTGRSIICVQNYLEENGILWTKIATLHWEIQSQFNIPEWRIFHNITPNYFIKKVITKTENPYLVYPWEKI